MDFIHTFFHLIQIVHTYPWTHVFLFLLVLYIVHIIINLHFVWLFNFC